ncbi:hypothetical protein WAK64_07680 [Bacillus spongiae]|uniref:Uncharacterized protein n=1 Tax=Bacillus spongiae TaxID=2683610 RepID=A0ABU8HCG2_9BACI
MLIKVAAIFIAMGFFLLVEMESGGLNYLSLNDKKIGMMTNK